MISCLDDACNLTCFDVILWCLALSMVGCEKWADSREHDDFFFSHFLRLQLENLLKYNLAHTMWISKHFTNSIFMAHCTFNEEIYVETIKIYTVVWTLHRTDTTRPAGPQLSNNDHEGSAEVRTSGCSGLFEPPTSCLCDSPRRIWNIVSTGPSRNIRHIALQSLLLVSLYRGKFLVRNVQRSLIQEYFLRLLKDLV